MQKQTSQIWMSRFVKSRDVRQLPAAAIHAVLAMRLCVICHKVDQDPSDDLVQRFGNQLAAQRFLVVFEVLGAAWPEPFMVSRGCCPRLTVDEALFADMAFAVSCQDRVAFDAACCEMFGSDAREALFTKLSAFERARLPSEA